MNTCISIFLAVVASANAGFLHGGLYRNYAAPLTYGYGHSYAYSVPTYYATPIVKTYAPAPVVKTYVAPIVKTVRTVQTTPVVAKIAHAPVIRTYAPAPIIKYVAAPIVKTYAYAPVPIVKYVAPVVKTYSYAPAPIAYVPRLSYASSFGYSGYPYFYKK